MLVAATAVFATSCGGDASANIVEVQETNDPVVLDVIIDTCNAEVSVDVRETASTVELSVDRADSDDPLAGTNDCLDLVRVDLIEPLGSRTLTTADGTQIPFVALQDDEP